VTLLHHPRELAAPDRKVCLAIGVFDGVHLGHQQVIRQAVADAEQQEGLAVVATFDCHPNTVVAPERVPPLIYSLPQKLRAIAALGVDATWVIHFDAAFSQQTGEEFVRGLAREFPQLHSVCVGGTFTFGHKRSGNVALLQRLGRELGFQVHGLAAVALDGQPVSSTRIRDAIRTGDFAQAGRMLGRPYRLAGRVVRGDQLGRTLGFPTANLDVAGLALPPRGVYAARVSHEGRAYAAVMNLGVRPTVAAGPPPPPRLEVHLLDADLDLYDQELEVTPEVFLRAEQRFPSLDELRAQIARDVGQARLRAG
jgi:riboflavin kinase/FMN adenylyltransferase